MLFNRNMWSQLVEGLSSGKVLSILLLATIALILSRLTSQALLGLGRRVPPARFTFNLLIPIIRIIIWTIAFLAATRVLSPSPEMLFAIVASIGLALGLGAQDYVKSLIGGVMILIDRP